MGLLQDIAAKTAWRETSILLGAPYQLVLPSRSNRFAVVFTCNSGGNILVTTVNPPFVTITGFGLNNRDMRTFTVKDHGALVQAEWFAASVGGGTLAIFEIFFPGE